MKLLLLPILMITLEAIIINYDNVSDLQCVCLM